MESPFLPEDCGTLDLVTRARLKIPPSRNNRFLEAPWQDS